ncbi:MAG: hypothetical protein M1395_07980 [Bacteroidetes bacterium]|jgi:hypothetical protein|nr:hypothetical protein [Bacteroidota bacterium]
MHYHPARVLNSGRILMMTAVYLVIGSLWITFGLVLEPALVRNHPEIGIIMAVASIVWAAISLIFAVYFIHKLRVEIRRVRHEGKA